MGLPAIRRNTKQANPMAKLIFTAFAAKGAKQSPYFGQIDLTEECVARIERGANAVGVGGLYEGAVSVAQPSYWGIPKNGAFCTDTGFEEEVSLTKDLIIIEGPIGDLRETRVFLRISENNGDGDYQTDSVSLKDFLEAARSKEEVVFFEDGLRANRERLEERIAEARDEEGLEDEEEEEA